MMDGDKIAIRAATAFDLPAVRQCAVLAYAQYTKRMGQKPAPMTADFEGQIAQGRVFVAQLQYECVGYAVIYSKAGNLHLESIAVLPAFAGKGFGKVLIAFVEQTARERGLDAVDLYTNEAMTENLSMYVKLGYSEVERKKQDGFNRVFFRKCVWREIMK